MDSAFVEKLAVELIKIAPSFLWFLLAVILTIIFYRPIRNELLPNLRGFKAMGIEFSFVQQSITTAIELAEKSEQWPVSIADEDIANVLNRVKKHLSVFKDSKILWIDDIPENNRNEERMFLKLQANVEFVTGTEDALKGLKRKAYDLVISDMSRGNEATAGLKFLEEYSKSPKAVPVIFYVGFFDPEKGVPPKAFGITNRPDELLHLTLDALERKKY
jgi:CheY-like chemotaxis protein